VSRRADLVTFACALSVHAGLAFAITRGPVKERTRPRAPPVLLRFERPRPEAGSSLKAPAAAVPRPSTAPPIRRKIAMRARVAPGPQPSPPPLAPPAAPAPAAPKPVFGVSMASTNEVAAASVPLGSPGGSGARRSGAPTPPAQSSPSDSREDGTGYRPVSELDVGVMPEVDAEACGRAALYPPEAEQSGIEGDVRLRVSLNEKGGVHAVRVLSGLGHGLDRAAMEAIKTRCKFSAAIARDGRPVPFVIESYTFHFQLPR